MLLASVAAHAKAFKGLIDRRALNDPTVKSSKVIQVELKNYKLKFKKEKKSDRLAKKNPPKARTIRELRVIKIDGAKVVADGKAAGIKKGGSK